jgi:hypothetical protein
MKVSEFIKKLNILIEKEGDFEIKKIIKHSFDDRYNIISAEFDENGRTGQLYLFSDESSRNFRKVRKIIANSCRSEIEDVILEIDELYDGILSNHHIYTAVEKILEIIRGDHEES